MKLFIASDIHGSAYFCEKMLEAYKKENAERLVLLGDILYHGPRNELPRGYEPKRVAELLNGVKDEILCVRGNCEAEVDQMMLEFPALAEYALIALEDGTVFATHGHNFGENSPPPLKKGDFLLCGHTHVPKRAEHENFVYLNPGSVSIPKENSQNSYMVYENGKFSWKTLEGEVFDIFDIK